MKSAILITAGPTREKIDPIRYISNYSTGTFGYEIAKEARRRGYPVILVSGPVAIKAPSRIKLIAVESASQMYKAVKANIKKCCVAIMAAAVADWRPKKYNAGKIKRHKRGISLDLIPNIDIAGSLGKRKRCVLVGFALETERLRENAVKKLKNKNLDIIVANKTGKGSSAFGDNKTNILIIDRYGSAFPVRNKSKRQLAKIILDKALRFNI